MNFNVSTITRDPCQHCDLGETDHVRGKCPFAPTQYAPKWTFHPDGQRARVITQMSPYLLETDPPRGTQVLYAPEATYCVKAKPWYRRLYERVFQ